MKPNKGTMKYAILIFGLIAYTFSGLNWNMGIAAWIAPIFVLYFTKNSKWSEFLFLYLGMACSAAISKSAENLSGLFIINITTGLSYGIVYSIPYIIEKLLIRKEDRFYSTFIFPSAVVFTEYLLSLVMGIWGNASIAQYYNFNFIQISSVFGIFGISFLVAWFASMMNWIVRSGVKTNEIRKGLATYGVVIVAVLLYGGIRTGFTSPDSETVKVAAIASETDIHRVFNEWGDEIIELSKDYEMEIPAEVFSNSSAVESQINKTKEALSNGAKIVVWNEISLILTKPQVDSLLQHIKKLCMKNQAYILIAFLEKNTDELPKPFNNKSILVGPDGGIAWEYLKYFLNPLEGLVINKGGASIPFIDTEYGRIGNAICSDIDLTRYISQTGKKSIDIILVPAFDWEAVTPYHSNMAAFAAIQYGVSIIRSNGKGIVAFYDYHGDALAKTNTLLTNSKINYAEIPMKSPTTVYSVIGNLFVYVVILFLMVIAGLRLSNLVMKNERAKQ
jgi:apolipoprotein N-acyltransferase